MIDLLSSNFDIGITDSVIYNSDKFIVSQSESQVKIYNEKFIIMYQLNLDSKIISVCELLISERTLIITLQNGQIYYYSMSQKNQIIMSQLPYSSIQCISFYAKDQQNWLNLSVLSENMLYTLVYDLKKNFYDQTSKIKQIIIQIDQQIAVEGFTSIVSNNKIFIMTNDIIEQDQCQHIFSNDFRSQLLIKNSEIFQINFTSEVVELERQSTLQYTPNLKSKIEKYGQYVVFIEKESFTFFDLITGKFIFYFPLQFDQYILINNQIFVQQNNKLLSFKFSKFQEQNSHFYQLLNEQYRLNKQYNLFYELSQKYAGDDFIWPSQLVAEFDSTKAIYIEQQQENYEFSLINTIICGLYQNNFNKAQIFTVNLNLLIQELIEVLQYFIDNKKADQCIICSILLKFSTALILSVVQLQTDQLKEFFSQQKDVNLIQNYSELFKGQSVDIQDLYVLAQKAVYIFQNNQVEKSDKQVFYTKQIISFYKNQIHESIDITLDIENKQFNVNLLKNHIGGQCINLLEKRLNTEFNLYTLNFKFMVDCFLESLSRSNGIQSFFTQNISESQLNEQLKQFQVFENDSLFFNYKGDRAQTQIFNCYLKDNILDKIYELFFEPSLVEQKFKLILSSEQKTELQVAYGFIKRIYNQLLMVNSLKQQKIHDFMLQQCQDFINFYPFTETKLDNDQLLFIIPAEQCQPQTSSKQNSTIRVNKQQVYLNNLDTLDVEYQKLFAPAPKLNEQLLLSSEEQIYYSNDITAPDLSSLQAIQHYKGQLMHLCCNLNRSEDVFLNLFQNLSCSFKQFYQLLPYAFLHLLNFTLLVDFSSLNLYDEENSLIQKALEIMQKSYSFSWLIQMQ